MLRLNERPKVGRALAAASVWKWVFLEIKLLRAVQLGSRVSGLKP